MRSLMAALVMTVVAGGAWAQAPQAAAPDTDGGAPILCKDGSTWPTATRRGACRGHGGIAPAGSAAGAAAPSAAPSAAAPAAATPGEGTGSTAPATDGGAPILCKDGSTWPTTTRRGACRGHGGIAPAGTAAGAAAPSAAPSAAAPAAATPGEGTGSRAPATGAGAPILCKDGSTWPTATRRGACRGHGGIAPAGSASAAPAAPGAPASPASPNSAVPNSAVPGSPASSVAAPAAPASPAPAGAGATVPTAAGAPAPILCKDGSTWGGATRQGACRGHGGIQQVAPAAATQPAPRPPPPVAGAGSNQVWVNADTKVFHCADDIWFGRTKKGAYMTEAAARAAGNRPSRGKDCPDVPVPAPASAKP